MACRRVDLHLHHATGARQGLYLIDDLAAIIVIVIIELDFDDLAGRPGLRDGHNPIERQQLAAEHGLAQVAMFALVVLVAPERGYGDDRGQHKGGDRGSAGEILCHADTHKRGLLIAG